MAQPFTVAVDWLNDGTFTDTNDDVTTAVRATPGVKTKRGMDQVRPLGTIAAGSASFDLDNQSGTYSPENGSSPIHGDLVAGRAVRIQATVSSVAHDLWQGVLDDIQPHPERLKQSVSIPCLGNLSKLRITGNNTQPPPISTPLYQSITSDVAVGHVLDAIGFPAGKRVLNTGNVTFDWYWVDNQDAMTALQEIVNTEGPGARLYEDASGNIVFEGHDYRWLTSRCTTSQATFSDGTTGHTTEPMHSEPFTYSPGLKDIVNYCTATAKVRALQSQQVVWSLTPVASAPVLFIAPNDTQSVIASGSDPFLSAVTPAVGTDIVLAYGSLSGVTLTDAQGNAATSGQRLTINLTAGANGAAVQSIQLQAQPATVQGTYDLNTSIDTSTSITAYGKRLYPLQLRSEVNANVLQSILDAIPWWWQQPRPSMAFTLVCDPLGQDSRYVQAVTRQVSDRVTVQATNASVNDAVWIENVAHDIQHAGKVLVSTIATEQIPTTYQPFILDTSQLDGATNIQGAPESVLWFGE